MASGDRALTKVGQLARRWQGLDSLEQVAQREARRERDVGVVVDNDGKVERRIHRRQPSAIVRKRTVPSQPSTRFGTRHCNDRGMKTGSIQAVSGAAPSNAGRSLSISGHALSGGGQ